MLVRDETAADTDAVAQVIAEAFAGRPYSDGSEPQIMAALRGAGALTLALVAEIDGAVVGQAAFSPLTAAGRSSRWYGLGPVAVRPDCQRQGVGSAMIGHGLERLRSIGADGCVVVGDPAYYRRFGFRRDPALLVPGLPPEYVTVLPFGDALPAGPVAYHPAFGVTG